MAATDSPAKLPHKLRLRARLRALYHGMSPIAVRFRLAVIGVDLAIIAFFVAAPLMRDHGLGFYLIDYAIAVLLAADIVARAVAHGDLSAWMRKPIVWVDLFVLITLLAPAWLFNLGFLRVMRLWTLVHSDFFWRTVGRRYDDTRVEEICKAASTLITFVFVVTGFVYSAFIGRYEGIGGYVDALYFTVTSLTTTGYGDIVLPGVWGKLLSIAVMLGGVSLFIGLIQSILRPHKISFRCPSCGLGRHDPDAVHCKACGDLLNIPDNGA
ncbi:MAG: Ion transport 2 domain protein [Caulobacter sp.]|nr:Ion transport 2 domain protein [Caulobacter sp.]